jgi:hypothetical protein
LLGWLWPIGIGGQMPLGGDVTQFFLGLMGFFAESLRSGQLPVWNDLWGYGFPGLAESQMGVYYPVHVLLYGRLETETAYVVSLVLHTLWGGIGTFFASRRLGISGVGSALAGFSWSMCGFFLIHLAHPWGYTTGCWMPWALGLTWAILAPGSPIPRAAPFLLSLVLVLQILPGHFQLAFQTQFLIALMLAWAIGEDWWSKRRAGESGRSAGPASIGRRAGCVVAALVAAFPMAALQLVPTARLAELAGGPRDFEYLSGFAATPFHLVNFLAPGLFHRSPLWRPLVWNPFHTSPEECLTYVGLVPLVLAGLTMVRQSRREAAVRLLTLLAVVTLFLSLGPYVPGFRSLIQLPGFSFFRAPARWSLATALALALLAGRGFDRWAEWPRPGRAVRQLLAVAVAWILLSVGLIELAVLSTAKPGWPGVTRGFDSVFRSLPWSDDPRYSSAEYRFEAVMAKARQEYDPHIPDELGLSRVLQKPVEDRIFTHQRWRIYARELWETAALLAAIWALLARPLATRPGVIRAGLVVITLLDLWVLGRHRLIDVGPLGPLASRSPLLTRLARESHGTRTADPMRNLPMRVGLAPISSYRTLNLPALDDLLRTALEPMSDPDRGPRARAAMRATGAHLRIFSPVENRINHVFKRAEAAGETIEDPNLASWLYGAWWTSELGPWVGKFTIWRAQEPPVRAWLLPLTEPAEADILDEWSGDPRELLPVFERAEPLAALCWQPGEWTIWLDAVEPAWVIVSQLADPQWTARWIGQEGQGESDEAILPSFRKPGEPGGWQRVLVPGRGLWTLRLEYQPSDVILGVAISTIAWAVWVIAALKAALRRRTAPIPTEPPSERTGIDRGA